MNKKIVKVQEGFNVPPKYVAINYIANTGNTALVIYSSGNIYTLSSEGTALYENKMYTGLFDYLITCTKCKCTSF
jgi:hypothetical protein